MIKKTIILICTALGVLCGCQKAPTAITKDTPKYSGLMSVLYEGENFNQEDIKVQVAFAEDEKTIDIKFLKVKFAPAMPVSLDVTVMGIPAEKNQDGSWTFSGDDITPWALGGPYDTYKANDLQGTLTDSRIEFSLGFFNTKKSENYPTTYSGTK